MENFWIRLSNTLCYKSSFTLVGHGFNLNVEFNGRNNKRVICISDNDDIVYLEFSFIDKDEVLTLNNNFELLGFQGSVSLVPYSKNINKTDYRNWQDNYALLFVVKEIDK